jgi:heme oxygenase (mycobilin-producing)
VTTPSHPPTTRDAELVPIANEASATLAASGCPFHPGTGPARDAFVQNRTDARPASMFVALSKFVIANDKTAEVKEAFRQRPHLVDGQPGYVRMEVFSPLDRPEEIWLVTYWTDAESFKRWHHSHLYHESHKGIPKGLKLVPGEQEIRHFEHICS